MENFARVDRETISLAVEERNDITYDITYGTTYGITYGVLDVRIGSTERGPEGSLRPASETIDTTILPFQPGIRSIRRLSLDLALYSRSLPLRPALVGRSFVAFIPLSSLEDSFWKRYPLDSLLDVLLDRETRRWLVPVCSPRTLGLPWRRVLRGRVFLPRDVLDVPQRAEQAVEIDGLGLPLEETTQLVQGGGRRPVLVVADPRDARKSDADAVRGVHPLVRKLGARYLPYRLLLFIPPPRRRNND